MSISGLSVRRGVTFGMAYLILVGFGLFSLSRLQLDLYPDITFPIVLIITTYTGASPEDIETLVTRPIEGSVSTVKGVEDVKSDSKEGASMVTVEFDWDKDMEQAETEVRRSLEMVEGFLPEDADDSIVFAFDPSMQPIIMMILSGPYPQDELRRIAEDEIGPRLERIEGIATSEAAGGLKREIHVTLDPAKVEAFGLNVNAILGAIYQENMQEPGGSIEQGKMDFTIQTEGKYRSVEEIGEVLIGMRGDANGLSPLRLKDVARVEDGFVDSKRVLDVDGEPAVWLIIRKQSGANTVNAAVGVMEALPQITKETGLDIDFKILFNQADFITDSLSNLTSTALMGIGISFMVLILFLKNIRSSLVVASAIPVSVIATFFVMDQAHMTLNMISMAGLALAIGMLVDNAIVVLENIFRLREEGLDIRTAAENGASEVSMAVTASTLTTISVFVPILFVPGIAGVMFQDMAVTICFALGVSLVVALTFIPLGSSRLLGTKRAERLLERARGGGGFVGMRNAYGGLLDWTLRHRWVVGVGLVAILGMTAVIMTTLPTEFVQTNDQSQLYLSVETPIGNNLKETEKIIGEITKRVEEIIPAAERKMIATDVGMGEGFTAIFSKGVHAGVVRIPLVKMSERVRSQGQIEDALREGLKDISGTKITVGMPFNVMGGAGDMEIEIRGHDLDISRRVGLDLRDKLLALPEMSEVNFSMEDQKPEIRVRFLRRKMAELGLSTAAVGKAISTYFMGRVAGRYSEGGDEYDILVRFGRAHRLDMGELKRMPVVTPGGEMVPLANIAEIGEDLGPVGITRLNQERVTRLSCTLKAEVVNGQGETVRKDLGKAIALVDKLLSEHDWPKNFSYIIGGTAEDFQTSFKYLGIALLVSIFLVYMVMASQFESLRQPFIILFTVPLAGVGVVLMFSLTGSSMDMTSMVGVVMLVGIVVNNGIVMIDAANQLRLKGADRLEAIAQAARIRLRPVLMTSLTTILAMVPLALEIGEGAEVWSGMAKAVIGGLLVATLLTLVVIPTMYTLFARKKEAVR